ncbi:MAG: hypothetical protein RBT47_03065 [Anaerolineae bacterium]|nr:hypothetical protein [Anaerolineae bacterium]
MDGSGFNFKFGFFGNAGETPQGGVPAAEFLAAELHFATVGLNPYNLFRKRLTGLTPEEARRDGIYSLHANVGGPIYFDFSTADRAALRPAIINDPGVQARRTHLHELFASWWEAGCSLIVLLPDPDTSLDFVRKSTLESFERLVGQSNLLTRPQLKEVVTAWWEEVESDLQTLDSQGSFLALVDSWIAGTCTAPQQLPPDLLAGLQLEGEHLQEGVAAQLTAARPSLTEETARDIVLAVERERLVARLDQCADAQIQIVVDLVESWWDKYHP